MYNWFLSHRTQNTQQKPVNCWNTHQTVKTLLEFKAFFIFLHKKLAPLGLLTCFFLLHTTHHTASKATTSQYQTCHDVRHLGTLSLNIVSYQVKQANSLTINLLVLYFGPACILFLKIWLHIICVSFLFWLSQSHTIRRRRHRIPVCVHLPQMCLRVSRASSVTLHCSILSWRIN